MSSYSRCELRNTVQLPARTNRPVVAVFLNAGLDSLPLRTRSVFVKHLFVSRPNVRFNSQNAHTLVVIRRKSLNFLLMRTTRMSQPGNAEPLLDLGVTHRFYTSAWLKRQEIRHESERTGPACQGDRRDGASLHPRGVAAPGPRPGQWLSAFQSDRPGAA